jgi:hypothetical protein
MSTASLRATAMTARRRPRRFDASFYIGQILEKEFGHVRVDALSIGHRRIAMGAASGLRLHSFASGIGELAK